MVRQEKGPKCLCVGLRETGRGSKPVALKFAVAPERRRPRRMVKCRRPEIKFALAVKR